MQHNQWCMCPTLEIIVHFVFNNDPLAIWLFICTSAVKRLLAADSKGKRVLMEEKGLSLKAYNTCIGGHAILYKLTVVLYLTLVTSFVSTEESEVRRWVTCMKRSVVRSDSVAVWSVPVGWDSEDWGGLDIWFADMSRSPSPGVAWFNVKYSYCQKNCWCQLKWSVMNIAYNTESSRSLTMSDCVHTLDTICVAIKQNESEVVSDMLLVSQVYFI